MESQCRPVCQLQFPSSMYLHYQVPIVEKSCDTRSDQSTAPLEQQSAGSGLKRGRNPLNHAPSNPIGKERQGTARKPNPPSNQTKHQAQLVDRPLQTNFRPASSHPLVDIHSSPQARTGSNPVSPHSWCASNDSISIVSRHSALNHFPLFFRTFRLNCFCVLPIVRCPIYI